ncbi:DUF1254 domain-containing protein [Denitratisoma oestradiolicum]|uniref:DUF1254 domain-containing protein n=1 Tax=Denitratisoma oestradiolicum TaxID=311182 RepID=A0A6S6YAT6_9PROT|nr:DUF1254 domain-containing protein [Denitratisoma oestradiolicum]TWO79943.1 hypothetical protein CBW56_12635 [Denitratisoma oestradiolicum]CAB1369702.1 conserved exported protein of unknown function [Denitratisoma oestradiolicum]
MVLTLLRRRLLQGLACCLGFAALGSVRAEDRPPIAPALGATEIQQRTKEAFFWGMQQVGFYELRHVFTMMEGNPAYRGINRVFGNTRLLSAKARFATTPNASTLYSGGLFDLRNESIVVETPQMPEGRYWSIQAADHYAHWFFFVGSPFTGNAPQRYLIVGPDWKGRFPPGFKGPQIIRATSNAVTITLRLGVLDARSSSEMAEAGRLVKSVNILPLSLWAKNGGKPVPLEQQPMVRGNYASFPRMNQISDLTRTMTPLDYLQLVSLVINDPSMTQRRDSAKEIATLKRLADIGLREGYRFDPTRLTPNQIKAIEAGFLEARREAQQSFATNLLDMNGWQLQTSLFYDDNDYALRAGAAEIAWGSPVPFESHTIAFGLVDDQGHKLDGAHRYTLSFDINDLPPVTEFWEIPVYDDYGYFVDNPIDRYSATSYLYKAGAYHVANGRLTFYLQSERPTDPDQAKNWLPIPQSGGFRLAPRFYGPTSPLIDGSYPMPRLMRNDG